MEIKRLVGVTLIVLAVCSAGAEGQETGGVVQGAVVDSSGGAIPGAAVRIEGGAVSQSTTTDGQGRYRFAAVPPGAHRVTVAVDGFRTLVLEDVNVLIGRATAVNVTLALGAVTEAMTVTAVTPRLDTTQTTIQTNLTAAALETLPKGVNMSSVFKLAPAARPEPLSGQFQIDGASGSENSFLVDGLETSNFRTGVLNLNNNLPFEFVEEMSIKTSGFNAEFGGATGGVVNVVTKSGTNQFRGLFGSTFEPGGLQGNPRKTLNAFRSGTGAAFVQVNEYLQPKKDTFTNYFPVMGLGGPVVADRVWFFMSYTPQVFRETRTTEYFTSDPRTRTKTTEATYSRTRHAEYVQARVDSQPSNTLRVSGAMTFNPYIENGIFPHNQISLGNTPPSANFGGSTGVLSGPTLTSRQGGKQDGLNTWVNANWVPSTSFLGNLRAARGYLNERLNSRSIPELTRFVCTGLAPPSYAGCALGFNNLPSGNTQIRAEKSTRMSVEASGTWRVKEFGGDHQIKGGYQFSRLTNDVNRGYVPLGYVQLYYGYEINDLSGRDDPVSPTAIGAGQLVRFGTVGKASNTTHAIFLQDQWQPASRLTINAGLRMEKEDLPSFNGFAPPIAFGFFDKMVPRLGVAYALTEDNRTKVFSSFNRFQDRLKFELPRGSFGGDFYRLDFFEIQPNTPYTYYSLERILGNNRDVLGGTCPITNSSGLSRCQYDYRIASNSPNADIYTGAVDPNLKPFTQTEWSFGMERQLGAEMLLSARYTHKQVDHAIEDAGFPTAEGSEAYIIGNPGEGLHATTAREFGYAKTLKAVRDYDALELRLDRRSAKGVAWNVSYTLSRLFGNYSGLASSDEVTGGQGRTSPGVNRFFDLPHIGFTAAGNPDNGRLATDRPHVLNAYGAYGHEWSGRQSTTVSVFSTVQSGTPLTSFYTLYAQAILFGRGDLGRTPVFTNTDLLLAHRLQLKSARTLTFELNVLNLFDEANVLGRNTLRAGVNPSIATLGLPVSGEPAALNYILTNGIVSNWDAYINSTAAPQRKNTAYGMDNLFQGPRAVRLGVRFSF